MPKTIRFSREYTVKAVDGPTYQAGQVVTLEDSSADHFLNRQVASEVESKPAAAKPPAKTPAKDEDKDKDK